MDTIRHRVRFSLFLSLIALSLVAACTKQYPFPPDWWILCDDNRVPKTVVEDGANYIRQLPPEQRALVGELTPHYYTNNIGQSAMGLDIPLNGTWKDHFLIYNSSGVRIKTLTYSKGHYSS